MRSSVRRAALAGLVAAISSSGLAQEPFSAAGTAREQLHIGRITIRSLNVFSPEEATRGWAYRAANSLHIDTRESVIRKFLLFKEGDPYDPSRLEETERNLRAQPFLKTATVLPGEMHDGFIDVEVTTQDSWTTQPGGSLGKKGGVTTYSVSLVEKNLLGTGRELAFSYGKDVDLRIIRSIEYLDPYLFGPYWLADFLYANNSDGTVENIQIGKPFYSFLTPWAANLNVGQFTQNEHLYTNGEETSTFQQHHRELDLEYGKALTRSDILARRLTFGFDGYEDNFKNLPDHPGDVLPDKRDFRYLLLRYEDVSNDFLKVNFINRDSRFEDFNLGSSFSAEFGVSPAAFGLERTTERIRLSAGHGWRLSQSSFLTGLLSYQTRLDSGTQNEILSGTVFYTRKFNTELLQTFVSRLQFDFGWNLDRDVQFFADGETGLRGYRLHSFEGNKRIIWNAEHRLFSGKEVLQLVSFGAAVFFDTGLATPVGEPLRFSEFKSDVGVGIRMAISRAASNSTLRVDFAYALNPDPFGRKGWLVSFSSGQGF
jgi:hypothetical protein